MKVLVFNRGEIAARACLAARRVGLRSVLFVPPCDEDGPALTLADEVYPWPHEEPARSFLSLDAVGQAVRDTGSALVYPGYGFLAESAALARAVADAGARLVGPTAAVLEQIAHKGRARELARRAGLGDLGLTTPEAGDFPVMLKAVAGGGGRGNLVVQHVTELAAARADLARRARELFGDDELLIERYLPAARHVELQFFGAGDTVRVLSTRDCTLQRNHQKVIEEGPARADIVAALTPLLPALEHELAALGYRGAGTVELLWDGRLAFLEINPRIQVEHTVTEALLGIDLVEWQLVEAAGDGARLLATELAPRGHAVEARLYAEDPAAGFVPDVGSIHRLTLPTPPFCRWDPCVQEGSRVTRHYDAMLGKLVVWGRDRGDALARARLALGVASVHGVHTNLDFLTALLADETVLADQHTTRFIESTFLPGWSRTALPGELAARADTIARQRAAPGPAPSTANAWKQGHRR